MKKLLSLLLALMMFSVPALSLAEDLEVVGELIGGAEAPTGIVVADEVKLPAMLGEDALAAGRRVTSTLSFTELTGMETGEPTVDAAIADLFKALALRVSRQGDEADLALQLSGQDALTLGFAANGADTYIKSNLLGGTIVVSADEIEPLINRLLDMMVLMEAMTEEDAAALREQLATVMDSVEGVMASTMESAMAIGDISALNTTALEQLYASMQGKVEMVDVVTVPKMCDPAAEAAMMVLSNEDMVAVVKEIYQFLLDNPALMDYLGSMMGLSTEEQLDLMWETSGEIYKAYGLYESEEEFRADNMTFKQIVETAMSELDGRKVLDGEFTLMLAVDENGEPVWATMSLPVYVEEESVVDETQMAGQTTKIDVTYVRQTVAQGVAHTCNITVDGETMTIDVLASDTRTTISVGGVDSQGNSIKLLDASITTADDKHLTVDVNIYDGELHEDGSENKVVCHLLLDSEWEFTAVRSYFAGKLTVTVYEEYDGAQTENTLVFELKSDYAINGVDFSGATDFAFEVEGVRFGMQVASETSDPEASIMSGDVVRPAELDDSTFANWFVRVINALNSWMSTVVMALPESVLTLILSSSM